MTSRRQSPQPRYPDPEPSSSRPPPFCALYDSSDHTFVASNAPATYAAPVSTAPAYTASQASSSDPQAIRTSVWSETVAQTKRALPRDTKPESSNRQDESEPPPAYSEEPSPLPYFRFLMASAGGASSIITQVQQGGPPINAIGDVSADETITMDLRGTRFVLSRDELLTLPEFVLLSLFPNGLFPEGHMGGFGEGDAVQVDVS